MMRILQRIERKMRAHIRANFVIGEFCQNNSTAASSPSMTASLTKELACNVRGSSNRPGTATARPRPIDLAVVGGL